MTGSPLLRLALVVIALIALAIPLAQVASSPATTSSEESAGASPTPAVKRSVSLQLDVTAPPQDFGITLVGQPIASDPTQPVTLTIPPAGADLVVSAKWPDAGPHAVRVRASEDGNPIAEQTFWAAESLEDVLTLPASAP
ncbi:MAG: hypothetical protein WA771_15520 [Chthoniobacterales bacterium]